MTQAADDSTMSPKALAESPNVQKALYVQLVAYIFPSCTLLPFLLEPLGTTFLPYLIGKALVRTRPEVTVRDAEQCLQNPPYDLSRYGDILVNMMLCCMTMMFTYPCLWMLFCYMIVSLLVIYTWDHMRVLRFTTKSVFATCKMDNAVAYMMAMPTGVIAMCLVFKAYAASHHGFLDGLRMQLKGEIDVSMDRYNIFAFLALAFVGHVTIHWMLLKYVVFPLAEKEGEEEEAKPLYSEVGAQKPANYFNTNPINCLRSQYVYKHDPPCVAYRIGKEHLLRENGKLGLHFEAKAKADRRHSKFKSRLKGFVAGV